MKPLFTLNLQCRDPLDGKPQPLGSLVFDYPGSATLILDRDEMGVIKMPEAPTYKPFGGFIDLMDQMQKELAELHRLMVEGQMCEERTKALMFEVHRWLTG